MPEPEFSKPIFRHVWPTHHEEPSLDQVRFMRVTRRGVIRLGILVVLTLNLVAVSAISIVYLTSTRDVSTSVILGIAIATYAVLVFRGWMLGTYVNDKGCKVVRMMSTRVFTWANVIALKDRKRAPYKLPIGISTQHLQLVTTDSQLISTHIFQGSIDGIFSTENYEINRSLMQRWLNAK